MINILVSVVVFAGVKRAFLRMFTSEYKRNTQISKQRIRDGDPYLMERPDGRLLASSSLLGNRIPGSTDLA
jgi:hypothetical protein